MGNIQFKIQCHYFDCDDAIIEQANALVNQTRDELSNLAESSGASFSIHKEILDHRADSLNAETEVGGEVRLSVDETRTLLNLLQIAHTLIEQHSRPQTGNLNGTPTLDMETLLEQDKMFLPLVVAMREALEQKVGVR